MCIMINNILCFSGLYQFSTVHNIDLVNHLVDQSACLLNVVINPIKGINCRMNQSTALIDIVGAVACLTHCIRHKFIDLMDEL